MSNPHFQAMLATLEPLDEPIRSKKPRRTMKNVYERPAYKQRNKRLARAMKRTGGDE